MPSPSGPYRYRLFGLTLHSEIELPELFPLAEGRGDEADIVIARGMVAIPEGVTPVAGLRAQGDLAVLRIKPLADIAISGGARITVDAEPGAPDHKVRLYILGTAMGVLLHERGIVPLHANAIDLGGRAIAFMGKSGSGKSTLAAAFHDAGWRVLCDDVCAVTRGEGGFLAQPGIPRLRLLPDAIERSGRTIEGHARAFDDVDKYVVGIAAEPGDAVPLAALYLLGPPGDDFAIRRLEGADALNELIANTYRGRFVAMVGDQRRYFETCLAMSRSVPVFELTRPWDGARIAETIALIEARLA